jgi:hypothetical protein
VLLLNIKKRENCTCNHKQELQLDKNLNRKEHTKKAELNGKEEESEINGKGCSAASGR